tara:strand:- start:13972 stop:14937 length:966 start_codon:yes stop_codon:yes gene_type:complete
MITSFEKKFFSFNLSSAVVNAKYKTLCKRGWIIKIKDKYDQVGFGEISPILKSDFKICEKEMKMISGVNNKIDILENIQKLHPCIQSGIKCAIHEMKGKIKFKTYYDFEHIDKTAILLCSKKVIEEIKFFKKELNYKDYNLTFKWKVGIQENGKEEKILEEILNQIPLGYRLRIDANGSWDRNLANRWANILQNNKNLDWLEQPLPADDIEGLKKLNQKIPIALDESLMKFPQLIDTWPGWQIRRPSQESNPMKLLKELINKKSNISISSSFETGIGRRFIFHCAFLQLHTSTPKIPGLALKQTPNSFLFSNNPYYLWGNL